MVKESIKKIDAYVIIGIVVAALILISSVVLAYGYSLTNTNNVYDGVKCNGYDLSGKSLEACESEINNMIKISDDEIIGFKTDDREFELTAKQIGFQVYGKATANAAYSYGRDENGFKNIVSALKAKIVGVDIPVLYQCDEKLLMAEIEANLSDRLVPVTPYTVEIAEDCLVITNGSDGIVLEQKDISGLIIDNLSSKEPKDYIELTFIEEKSKPIDVEEFFSVYLREPSDATYSQEGDKYIFTKEVEGISFDKEQARAIIENNRDNKESYKIPAVITKPQITIESLQSKFSSDCLATFATNFASSDWGRVENIILATKKINGVVLNPGERFSYNGVVGPRTASAGFKVAHVYEGDKVVDGIGGGICQVSSTLYNAVLRADLKIVSRTNHSMPVAYVPVGTDATVSYGTIDFVFENNKKHPIKIVANTKNRVLTVSIYGVKDSNYTIELATENVGYIPYSTKEVVNTSMKHGEKKTVKQGSNGVIVKTYKVYKENGAEVKREYTSKSTYIPVGRVVHVGPAPVESPPKQELPKEEDNKTPEVLEDNKNNKNKGENESVENVQQPEVLEKDEAEDLPSSEKEPDAEISGSDTAVNLNDNIDDNTNNNVEVTPESSQNSQDKQVKEE